MTEREVGVPYDCKEDVGRVVTPGKRHSYRYNGRRILIVLLSFCILLICVLCYSFYQMRFFHKVAARFGWIEKGDYGEVNYAVSAWKSCLNRINYDCDVVFFGDSITRGADFREYFDDVEICNLGYAGDTLFGMKKRVEMIKSVKPEKIFIMGGVNSLLDNNMDMTLSSYSDLLDQIRKEAPYAEIYVQSILPISKSQESTWYGAGICKNSTIRAFNERLQNLAVEKGMTYVDLYSVYERDGELNPDYTKDGLHIPDHYEPWAEAIREYIEK